MAESFVIIWMSATLSLTTLCNTIQFTFIICIMGQSPVLDFAGEIEMNIIRSFTQRKDLVVKRLGSWGVWLLAGKTNVCFFGPILRQSPRLYLTGSLVHSPCKTVSLKGDAVKVSVLSGWSCSLHLCIPDPGTFNPRSVYLWTWSEIFFRCLC